MYSGITTYFESGILTAEPVELVRMLYRGAIDAVEQARENLRAGEIAARSAQLTKAGAILAHLAFSVNLEIDPVLGRNLIELYDYMQRRLLRANLEQAEGPLAEVSQLLSTLLEAWAQSGPREPQPVRDEPVAEYAGVGYGGAEDDLAECAGQRWSL